MTKMVFSRTNCPIIWKLGKDQYVLNLYKVYMNGGPELTLTYFVAKPFFLTLGPSIR